MTSRSTFRNAAGDVAWQKQLRDRHLSEGVPPVPHLDIKRAIVRPVTRKLAEQIILKYEWLGTMSPTSHHYGIFFGSYCAGVTCVGFSSGANLNAYQEFGLRDYKQLAYLTRGANVHWSPKGANSKLVSWTCRLLARATLAKLIIAYSDTDAGEIGTIYQACNWVCVGKGSSTRQWVAPSGRVMDQKLPSDLRRKQGNKIERKEYQRALLQAGWTQQASNPKYRYVCILDKSDKRLIELVESKRTPYPKRLPASEVTHGDITGDQPGEGGSIPTRTL